ncbi:hypothetical protein TTX_2002 [Thermoproteus tenax Kra 1]|uniref:DUF131 domain-containing protein n=1 Tax=Thermoproteus tenax (strain ATCC 35583 / DSM 2078 / JCM 9277 / NBRC 100435 / Kra 1) TaxID=768679 RepID=G4RM21_THETK|nr:hypothetical protein TTX_2002 [Thermoproteus tenax Kra 1]
MGRLLMIGLMLILVGFMIMALAPLASLSQSQAAAAGCIVLFFIPICFGAGSPGLLPAAMVLTVIALAFVLATYLILLWSIRRQKEQS